MNRIHSLFEQKVPFVFRKTSKHRSIFIKRLLFILIFCFVSSILFRTYLASFSSNYSTTNLAHISNSYINWSIPDSTKNQFLDFLQNAPQNKETGRKYIYVSLANFGATEFLINCLCSMQKVGIPKNHRISIALDQDAFNTISAIDENVILLPSPFSSKLVNNRHYIEFCNVVKFKVAILYQLLLWNIEPIFFDADIVFMADPISIFRNDVDFQVQFDSKTSFRLPSYEMPVPWEVNLGFVKVLPTPAVLKFMPIYCEYLLRSPKNRMQSSFRKVLIKSPATWLNNDTIIMDTTSLLGKEYSNLTMRFFDPMLVTNPGAVFFDLRHNVTREAWRRNLSRPYIIHLFHLGENAYKKLTLKRKLLIFYDDNLKCRDDAPEGFKQFSTWTKNKKSRAVRKHGKKSTSQTTSKPEMQLVNQTKPNNVNRSTIAIMNTTKIALNETKINKTMTPKITN